MKRARIEGEKREYKLNFQMKTGATKFYLIQAESTSHAIRIAEKYRKMISGIDCLLGVETPEQPKGPKEIYLKFTMNEPSHYEAKEIERIFSIYIAMRKEGRSLSKIMASLMGRIKPTDEKELKRIILHLMHDIEIYEAEKEEKERDARAFDKSLDIRGRIKNDK